MGPRAARTRESILRAAEALFAERGFAATRLEDVAERVGIRRASIVYYWRDKRALYDAVLASLFGGLFVEIAAVLDASGPLEPRIYAAVGAWVDYVERRPTLAHILLRETAEGEPGRRIALARHSQPFFELVGKFLDAARGDPLADVLPGDAVLAASIIAGGTVFLVAVMPAVAPGTGVDPVAPDRLAGHKERMLAMTRHLIEIQRRSAAERGRDRGEHR